MSLEHTWFTGWLVCVNLPTICDVSWLLHSSTIYLPIKQTSLWETDKSLPNSVPKLTSKNILINIPYWKEIRNRVYCTFRSTGSNKKWFAFGKKRSDWHFSFSSLVPLGRCPESASNLATAVSFFLSFFLSLFFPPPPSSLFLPSHADSSLTHDKKKERKPLWCVTAVGIAQSV